MEPDHDLSFDAQTRAGFGAQMRGRRGAVGLSLGQLATMTFYNKGYLSRIETGAKPPTEELARSIDRALYAEGALIRCYREQAEPRRRRPPEPAAAGELAPVEPALATAVLTDPLVFAEYAETFRWCRERARSMPAALIVPMLEAGASVMVAAGDRPNPPRPLLLLAARYAEFLGWMLQEVGRDTDARRWTERAVQLAARAGDEEMAGHALLRHALFALYDGAAEQTIDLAVRAAADPSASARVRRQALQREAQGHALAGSPGGVHRALDLAEAVALDDEPNESEMTLGPTATGDSLAITQAWCLVELGDGGRAAEIFARQLAAIPPSRRRTRARFGVRHALAHAVDGELDEACQTVDLVLPDVLAVQSATVNRDVARLRNAVSRWRRDTKARGLLAILNAVLAPAAW